MNRVTIFCIVEGQTEQAVLRTLIAGHLGAKGIDFHTVLVNIGRGKGGVKFLSATQLYDQIGRFLKDRRQPFVTTFFDYYAFPTGESKGWDFVAKRKGEVSIRGIETTVEAIETEIQSRAHQELEIPGLDNRFIPYLQLHELEALFFSDPNIMAETFGNESLSAKFAEAVTQCGGCEQINDSPKTAPSKRIEEAFRGYKKGKSEFAHGPRIAMKLDLLVVREKCPRFDAWVAKLENLPNLPSS